MLQQQWRQSWKNTRKQSHTLRGWRLTSLVMMPLTYWVTTLLSLLQPSLPFQSWSRKRQKLISTWVLLWVRDYFIEFICIQEINVFMMWRYMFFCESSGLCFSSFYLIIYSYIFLCDSITKQHQVPKIRCFLWGRGKNHGPSYLGTATVRGEILLWILCM